MQTLETYAIFSQDDTPTTKHDIPASVLDFLGLKTPPNAVFTGLYGINSTLRVGPYIREHFPLPEGSHYYPVSVKFALKINSLERVGIDTESGKLISEAETLNTTRMFSDLSKWFKKKWKTVLGKDFDPEEAGFPKLGTKYPEKIDFLRDEKDGYPHLKAIVYQVSSPVGVIFVCSYYVMPDEVEAWGDHEGILSFKDQITKQL